MKKTNKTHNYHDRLLPKALIAIGVIFAVMVSCKCKKDPLPAPKPEIASFKVSDVTMTSVKFSFSASHYESLSLTVNGKTVPVSGTSTEVDGLTANTKYSASLSAKNGEQSASNVVSFTTTASSLKVDSFEVSKITASSITFGFASSSDVTITDETLTNTNSGEQFNVLGKKTYEVTNLEPNTKYTFALQVKDQSGNTKKETLNVATSQKASDWLKITSITYGKKFAIDGNAQSSEMDITLTNLSSATKTLKSLVADFGKNGKAIKMLRYQFMESRWTVLKPKGDTSSIEFANLMLKPGVNVIHTYFALLPNVGGVSNNAALTFGFVSLDDGDNGTLPHGGSFADPIDVGTVNANAEPSVVVQSQESDGIFISTMYGNLTASVGYDYSQSSIFSFGFELSGPSGARIHSMHLRNPWTSFPLSYGPNPFDPSHGPSWVFIDNRQDGSNYEYIDGVTWTGGENGPYITLVFPEEEYSKVAPNKAYNQYHIRASFKNDSNIEFNSDNFETPSGNKGDHGFILDSKYDITILNSDGQVIDLSDVNIYK